MIEHTVNDNSNPFRVTLFHEVFEIIVGSQTAVHETVIPGVIAMASGFKQRADVECRHV